MTVAENDILEGYSYQSGLLKAFQKALPDVFMVLDEEGYFRDVSSEAEELLVRPREFLLGRHLRDIMPEGKVQRLLDFIEYILMGQQRGEIEYSLETQCGERTFRASGSPLHDWIHGKRAVVLISRDITEEKKQAEELVRLRKLNTELEDVVARNEIELRRANQVDRARSLSFATMSHEVRTPLSGLIGMADLLETTDLDEDQSRFLDVIQSSGRLLLSVVNNVLDYSKIESGKLELDVSYFSPKKELEKAIGLFHGSASMKGIELFAEWGPGVEEEFPSDPTRLRQVVQNLLSNAIRHTDEGSVTLKAKVSNEGDDRYLQIEVVDTGEGIPWNAQESMFAPYYQARSSVPRSSSGTGLGLAISKRLVEALQGEIAFDSSEGSGSTFRFHVRGMRESEPVRIEAGGLEKIPFIPDRPISILVAEDNDLNRTSIQWMLEDAGFQPKVVRNGKEAVEAFQEEAYDLVLLDCQMPKMDGIEAARRIRKVGLSGNNATLVALTGHPGEWERAREAVAGFDQLQMKPVRLMDLEEVIRKATRQMSMRGPE